VNNVINRKLRKPTNGGRLPKGAGYRLITPTGVVFAGSLMATINGKRRIAIFAVPTRRHA
jgi:hypothetical protein